MSDWDVVSNSNNGWDVADTKSPASSTPSWNSYLQDYFSKGGKSIVEAAKSFIPAMAKGAIFQSSDDPLNQSVMNPETGIQKTARKTGEYVGKAVPFLAAASGVGAPVEAAVAGAGLPALAETAGGAATMAAYSGAKNLATQGLPDTGEKVSKLAQDVGLNTVAGAGMGTTGFLLGKAADFIGNKLPASIYNGIVRVTKGQALKDIKQGDYELIGGELAKLPGFTGTKQTMIGKATSKIDDLQAQIDKTIAPVANQPLIQTSEVIKPLEKLSSDYSDMPGYSKQKQTVDDLINETKTKLGDAATVANAQNLKKKIWQGIKDPQFAKEFADNPLFAKTQLLLGGGLRQQLSEALPALAPLNAEEGIYLGARQALQEEIARDRNNFTEKTFMAPAYESMATRGAQVAKKVFGSDSMARNTVSNIAQPATGVGISELLDKFRGKGRR